MFSLVADIRTPARVAVASAVCLHCGLPVLETGARFCCTGCSAVYDLLSREGLERYYELADGRGAPQTSTGTSVDHKWLEALDLQSGRVTLDAQGIHCAACVWLFENLFTRHAGALAIGVNPTWGTVRLTFADGFSVTDFVRDVERFGYRLGPIQQRATAARDPLLLRMGLCIAIAMNAMIFAVAFYAGLDRGPIFQLFHGLELALAAASVAIGGSLFIGSAWRSLQARVLHLDLPIALGIVLAFASSTLSYFRDRSGTYFDTLTIFIALMLVGRWLQERVVLRNRRELLENDGVDGLLTRRHEHGGVALVRCSDVRRNDRLLIAPGDLVPVDGTLVDARGTCSFDWINGESTARELAMGELVAAGAFNAGTTAFSIEARTDFTDSTVVELLRDVRPRATDQSRATPWWQRFARIYVAGVLLVGAVGFCGWWLATGDLGRALEVTAGVLIVTCPCAFGIATPLGYELVYAGLRRAGLFVRSPSFLDRAPDVECVVFDKTGTLTTGRLEVEGPATLLALPAEHLHALYNLAVRSTHPKSAAVASLLAPHARFEDGLVVEERVGSGLHLTLRGRHYRLAAARGELVFAEGEVELATLSLHEVARADARQELAALAAQGYDVWIVSGDAPVRVDALATDLGVASTHARGGFGPHDKAAFVAAHPRALMVGDGLNDSLAAQSAFCSGTPAVDRPFMPARTDFYFTTAGIGPVALALRAAKTLRRVTQRNLRIAVAYNVLSVGLAWAGLLSPLVCAVVMPVSSITVVMATVYSLSARSPLWRS